MRTTDYNAMQELQELMPRSHVAFQHLVVEMAKANKNMGKRTWFGRDKGLASYKKCEQKLLDVCRAMVLDKVMRPDEDIDTVTNKVRELYKAFTYVYPNWQDAYSFGDQFIFGSHETTRNILSKMSR